MKTINSFRSKLLTLTLALMASVASFAYEFEYVNDFHIDGFGYKIISVNTPDDGEGYVSLIEIADCKKDVVIPKYVSYGDRGFHVTTFGIGSVVFTNDASSVVESITIPKTTSVINKNALAGCPNLKTVVVDSENPYYDSRENCNAIITTSQNPYFTPNTLIAGCKTTVIPNSVVEIGDNAFYNCELLDVITIPNSVSRIGKFAFKACSSLSTIILSENLTAIGDWAFDDCNNLKEVICYALQPPTISQYTFSGISPTIYVPAESIERYRSATGWKEFEIRYISWSSEECHEYKHVNLTALPLITGKLTYRLSTDDGSEPPYVDSVWILNTDKEPLQKFYAQSGDTIDLLSLELGHYILRVYIDGCILSRTFVHRPKWKYTWCNQWNILSHGYQGPQDPLVAARTSIFWLSNNTVNRDGQEYIPLMCSSSKPDVESTNLIGELRFTEDKQVYFYYDNTEYLLYDFDVQVGDTLDIFGGIELYSYSFVEQKTYPHVITKIDTLDDGRLQITSDAIVIFEDGEVGTFEEKQQQIWIEGLGSINGIVHTGINPGIAGNPAIVMLCAYRDDECVYKTDSNDPYWIDYTQLGCVYNEGDFIEGAFPILSGLQRTVCNEYCGDTEDDNSANNTYKQTFDSIFFENDKPYILCNDYLLREEDNKILIYSQLLNKDLVLYDFTLEVGDSLPALYIDWQYHNAMDWIPYNLDVVDYNKDFDGTIYPADTFVVTDVSNVTLLDGKEYKKWTFNNGMEYVEGIGMYGGHRNGNFFGLIQEVVVPCHTGTHLVCVSKNNQLLYQMDDAEMERLGAECLCEYNSGPKKDNAKNGKIGGRPTPTQWNQLEMNLRAMENGNTILRAETFSYTLENDSIIARDKTFYQLARQSTKDTAITKSFVGALHFGEDEDNRVYFLRDGVEYVLYDFTAEPGDTIEIFAGINNYPQYTTYTHVVVDKDTTEDGACRMFLEVVFPDETTTATNAEKVWLAGLGSIDGIVHNAAKRTSDAHAASARSAHNSETQTSVMLCAWREDSCLYTTDHPDYDNFGCVYNQDSTPVSNTPSPMTDCQKLLLDGQLLIIYEGKTYNVLGMPIQR